MKKIFILLAACTALFSFGAELKMSAPQVITRAWGGKMTKTPEFTRLETTRIGKIFLCRMRRQILTPVFLWGQKTVYSFSACGKGKLQVSYYYNTSLYSEGFTSHSKMIPLTEEWKEYSVPLFSLLPDIRKTFVVVALEGEGFFAQLKNERLTLEEKSDKKITASPAFAVIPEKGTAEIVFSAPGRETLSAFDGKKNITLKGEKGKFRLRTAAAAAALNSRVKGSVLGETVRVGVWDKQTNMAESVYVSRVSDLQWSNFVNVSKDIKLAKPLSVLFLGDSLSDFYRGFNYIDELNFWINRTNPGKFTFRNAGIAGFTFKDLYMNINRNPRGRFLDRTKDIWNKKYDLIFIFLGHNDTVQHYGKDHKPRGEQPVAALNTYLPPLLRAIRQKSGAKIVLVSPASMDYERAKKFSAKIKRPGSPWYQFAVPERVVPFCAEMKKLAAKLGTDYIDMYSPTVALPEKERFFTAIDGVHLMPRGQHVIAFEILKYLAGKSI